MKIYTPSMTLQSIFEIGRRGLDEQQANMSVTANNISNVNTEGYTRQRINSASASALQADYLNVESGARPGEVARMRDTFYDLQIRYENPSLARWEQENHLLGQVETILNEPNDMGLSSLMDQYFNSWDQLSQEPDSISARTVVRDSAETLARTFNSIGEDLDNLQLEINDSITNTVSEMNYYIKEISETTEMIMKATEGSSEISTLMDRRDLALDKLSELTDIQYEEKGDGNIYVYSSGVILCEGKDYNELKTRTDDQTNNIELYWENELTDFKTGNGKMYSLFNIRDSVIPELEEELNTLVSAIVTETNSIHSNHFDLEGDTNINFFDADGLDIRSIKVAMDITQDVKNIAVSDKPGATGNAAGALAISDLQHQEVLDNNTKTIRDYYNGTITTIGNLKREADQLEDMEATFVNALENKRNEISEVDLDEELSNMIKFQQAYGACSKIISTVDQMLTTVIGLV